MEGDGGNGEPPSSSCSDPPHTPPRSDPQTRPVALDLALSSLHDASSHAGSLNIPRPGQMQHLGWLPNRLGLPEPMEGIEALLRSREGLVQGQSRGQQIGREFAASHGFLRLLQEAIQGKGMLGRGSGGMVSPSEALRVVEGLGSRSSGERISLREMLRPGYPRMNKIESLELLRKIVELVDFAHSQDVVLLDFRPSCFYLHSATKVKYIGPTATATERFSVRSVQSQRDQAAPLGPPDSRASVIQLEKRWYGCHEESTAFKCSTASNIYSLGVLLFELLCPFDSWEAQCAAMLCLRDRILPPEFLLENPSETGLCLWLLHPDHASRPTAREILQSGILPKSQKPQPRDVPSIPMEEDKGESELLLLFLVSLKVEKTKQVAKLVNDLGIIEEDLKEIHRTFGSSVSASSYLAHVPNSGTTPIRNLNQLEEAYFMARSHRQTKAQKETDELKGGGDSSAWKVGAFFDGLCKFARYSKIEERGSLRSGDLLGSPKVIRSVDLSRDEDYFATAGVSKKIKIYGIEGLLDSTIDVHCPEVEMSNNSKLSCFCWNRYIKNYIASTDYDGIVKIWDANTAQGLCQYAEHQKRAWAVDFCASDPAKFASSSDDCSVKLWHINEFCPRSGYLLAFGCADNNIYCYDMRQTRFPWRTLSGHGKSVSYVRFLDSESIVSASTDNSLKVWNLKQASSEASSSNPCAFTLRGHTNEKNFVGLSAWNGYIACGSETNEVFTYYKSIPVPIASFGFGSSDSAAGSDHGNEDGHFVSSVCWGQKQGLLLAANTAGNLKILLMV